MSDRPRSLSGIKPNQVAHWGNYFGMIRPAIELTERCECFYFIADYHALTTFRDPSRLQEHTHQMAAVFLACGLDPNNAVLWRQSDVPEVLELSWLLGCVTGYGHVERAHAFKDARARGSEVSYGVVSYPVLMASDILLYDSDVVPVGKDQVQHLEMTRDMALFFNNQFLGDGCHGEEGAWDGRGLKRPEALVREATAAVPGLDGRKMSKSYDNFIPVFGSSKQIKKRVMSIVTDSTPLEDPKDPDGCNVFQLYKLFATQDEQAELAAQYRGGNFGYGHGKLALLEKSQEHFAPMQDRYDELMSRRDDIEDVLQGGAARAREVARAVLDRAREACGLPLM